MSVGSRQAIAVTTLLSGVAGAAVAGPTTYLAVLSVAACRSHAEELRLSGEPPRLAVLVPAHNESRLIGRCLDGLAAQTYPEHLRELFVIADNCTDDTAERAEVKGATVMQRHDPSAPGKGRALHWAIEQLLISRPDVDAFVVIDADSVTDPNMLAALAAAHQAGAPVAQADYEALVEGPDPRSQLRAAAFLLFHRARFSGKAHLGLSCSLVGNGMLFSRATCEKVPWTSFSEAEDLEHGLNLRLAGVDIVFVPGAHLVAPVATLGPAAGVQRARWEGGRARIVRRYLPRLAREMLGAGRSDLWDAAADLAVPPVGLLAAAVAAGGAASAALTLSGHMKGSALVGWGIAGAGLTTHVVVGLRAAGAPRETQRALLMAPVLVLSEMKARAGLVRHRPAQRWVRTPRDK